MFEEVLEEMRVEDFVKLHRFHELAHEALEAEKLIKKVYSDCLRNEAPIEVYAYESFSEYYGYATLSYDWVWSYHDNWWGGRHWDINCTAEGIYELLRDAYLAETSENVSERRRFSVTPADHFRRFVEKTKKLLNEEN